MEATIVAREGEISRRVQSVAGGSAVICSRRCPQKMSVNEDSALVLRIDEERALFAVADGMGGMPEGEVASAMAIECLVERVGIAVSRDQPVRGAILDAFEQANHRLMSGQERGGTTLAVVELTGNTMRTYHAGDSMILAVGQRGVVRHQTLPHSPVAYAVEAGVLDPREAMHHADRHIVSNAIGFPEMHVTIGPVVHLRQRDTIIAASDGLFDNLHLDEVIRTIRCGPLERIATELVAACARRMGRPANGHPSKPDDATFVLFRRS